MSPVDYATRKIPDYYDTMFLDGFTPTEILYAQHQTMLKEIEARNSVDEIQINSNVKIK